MKQYIIFDIDGTLNRTDLYAVEAYEKALEKRDLKVERKEIIACIGLSPAAIIEKLFGILKEDELKAWRADIERYEAVLMAERACTFEGIEETLTALKSAGYGLSICSNAYPDHINRVLSALRLTSYFDRIGSLAMGSNKTEIIRRMIDETGCSALMVGGQKVRCVGCPGQSYTCDWMCIRVRSGGSAGRGCNCMETGGNIGRSKTVIVM